MRLSRSRFRSPRLRTVLLLSNLAILALPVAGLWALRLYESALLRQTESELVAQAAVLVSVFREQMHIPSDASAPGTPPQPAPAALHMAGRPGLDFALDPIMSPDPDDMPGPPPRSRGGRCRAGPPPPSPRCTPREARQSLHP